MGPSPQAVDWDNDGDYDIITGEYDGYVNLFRNIGTPTEPELTYEGHIQASGGDIDVGSLSTPVVNDWDEDGRKDLVVGMDAGYVHVFLNTGTDEVPVFGNYFQLQADGNVINKWKNFPEIADLNGDGLKDLAMGWIDGTCLYWPNYGTNAAPVFYESYELVGFADPIDPLPGSYNWSHMEVCDWDDDGDPDILFTRWESELFIHLNALDLLEVTVEPVDPPVIIPAGGGLFNFQVTLTNQSEETAIVDGWNETTLPGGYLFGPILTVEDLHIAGGAVFQFTRPQYVPGYAPRGIYTYGVYIGKMGNGYFAGDSFLLGKR